MDNIAIVGMGCLYPGYVTKDNFWEKIINGETFTEKVDFFGKTIERAKIPADGSDEFFKTKFSEEEFDELDKLGDLFKWTSYICEAALKDSGYYGDKAAMARTGMVLGIFGLPSKEITPFFAEPLKISVENTISTMLNRDDFVFEYEDTANLDKKALISDTEPSNYVSQKQGFGGPVLNLNAACSSPVYSIKIAGQYLVSGKADIMLAGAHCYNQLEEAVSGLLDLLGLLEDAGSCNPLDRDSKGAVGGSGAGMFVLKRLEDAIRDNDHIYGIVEGIGWSNDGNGKAILAPDATGQMISYIDAYKDGQDPNIDYLETHATGTLAGDLIEMHSINSYFSKRGGVPLLGALKGNTGHFFTASTHAAIAKVLLGMENNIIPKTVNVKHPISDKVIIENSEWVKKGPVKRAAINSFGFGGTNGHMIVREYAKGDPSNDLERPKFNENSKMAVVGIGMHVGEIESTQNFYKGMLSGQTAVKDLERERWTFPIDDPRVKQSIHIKEYPKGTYVKDYDFDYLEYKMPAKGNPFLLRKDFLALQTAAQAVQEAKLDTEPNPKTAVLINISQDYSELNFSITLELQDRVRSSLRKSWPFLNDDHIEEMMNILRGAEALRDTPDSVTGIIPSIKASRISSHWGFKGPTMAMMNGETGFARSLEIAQYLLSQDIVENVVVGSIELNGEIENVFVQQMMDNIDMLTEYGICEGATVFVLKKAEKAEADGNFIYGTIEGIDITSNTIFKNSEEQIKSSLSNSLRGVSNKQIGYVEMPISSPSEGRDALTKLLGGEFREKIEPDEFVTDSVERYCGIAQGLSVAIAMAKHMLMLANKVKIVNNEGRHFTWSRISENRTTLLPSFGTDGSFSSIVFKEYQPQPSVISKIKSKSFIMPVCASNSEGFKAQLEELEKTLASKRELTPTLNAAWEKYSQRDEGSYILCLVAKNKETLLNEIELAKHETDKMGDEGFLWESFAGSYITCTPIGADNKAVCMFPPGELFNSVKFFETLHRFPDLRDFYELYIDGSQLAGKGIKGSFLEGNTMALAEARTAIEILKEKLGIEGDYYVGASMGEFAAILATDSIVVEDDSQYYAILEDFYQLVEFMHNVDPVAKDYLPEKVKEWKSYYVSGDREALLKELEKEPLAFESIAGSPRDAIVAGDNEALQRVFSKFHGIAAKTKENPVSHTPIAKKVYSETTAFKLGSELKFKDGVRFDLFDGYTAELIDKSKENLIDEIKNIFTEPVNFQDMLEASYEKGGRLFIDMSANATCSAWVENTLRGKNYLSISMYPAIHTPEEHYLRALAKLISHGYPRDRVAKMFDINFNDKPTFLHVINMSMQHYFANMGEMVALPRERLGQIFEEAEGARPQALASAEDHAILTMRSIVDSIDENQSMTLEDLDKLDMGTLAPNDLKLNKEPSKQQEKLQKEEAAKKEAVIIEAQKTEAPKETEKAKPNTGGKAEAIKNTQEAERQMSLTLKAKAAEQQRVTVKNDDDTKAQMPLAQAAVRSAGYHALGNRALAYSMYLKSEQEILADLIRKMRQQTGATGQAPAISQQQPQLALPESKDERPCLYNREQILTMTRDSMAAVLGPDYEKVDTYPVRARMPLPPFLFVDRILKIDAEFGELKPGSIVMEYDITEDSLFTQLGMISYTVLTESAQIGIFLVGYMGIDEISNGTLRFRIVDTNATQHSDLPHIGDTFRGEFKITSFLKSGSTTLFVAVYNIYVEDRLVLTMNSIGGFFTEQDLSGGRGIIEPPKRKTELVKKEIKRVPIVNNGRSSYTDEELNEYYKGNFEDFIPEFDVETIQSSMDEYIDPRDPEFHEFIRNSLPKLKLLSRIVYVDAKGGEYGYGEIIAEHDIDEDFWPFKVHFFNDPIFPGSLMMEALGQAEFFMFIHTGYVLKAKKRRIYPILKRTIKSSFRGQIRPVKSTITYKVTIRDIEELGERTVYVFDARIYWNGVNVGKAEGFTACLE